MENIRDFKQATSRGSDQLTQNETRYIANFKPAPSVRDRILAQGLKGYPFEGQGVAAEKDPGRLIATKTPPDAPITPAVFRRMFAARFDGGNHTVRQTSGKSPRTAFTAMPSIRG